MSERHAWRLARSDARAASDELAAGWARAEAARLEAVRADAARLEAVRADAARVEATAAGDEGGSAHPGAGGPRAV
jgi:hypothetical protein